LDDYNRWAGVSCRWWIMAVMVEENDVMAQQLSQNYQPF
jgi:hypothetical protein